MIKERNINLTWLSEVMDKCHVSCNVLKINFQILYKTLVARTPIYIFFTPLYCRSLLEICKYIRILKLKFIQLIVLFIIEHVYVDLSKDV